MTRSVSGGRGPQSGRSAGCVIARRPPTCMPASPSARPGSSVLLGERRTAAAGRRPTCSAGPRRCRRGRRRGGTRRSGRPRAWRPSPTTQVVDVGSVDRLADVGTSASVGVGRIGRRDHGEDVDDERQRVAGLDHVALRLGRRRRGRSGCRAAGARPACAPTRPWSQPGDHAARRRASTGNGSRAVVGVELRAVLAAHADVVRRRRCRRRRRLARRPA